MLQIRPVVLVLLCNQREMKDMRINTLIVASFALLGLGGPVEKANAQIVVSVGIAPPALPVYTQPVIPGPGYIWTPGYWAMER